MSWGDKTCVVAGDRPNRYSCMCHCMITCVHVCVHVCAGSLRCSTVTDANVRAAITDLIATNNRLRRAVKNRDAEIASLKADVDKARRDLDEEKLIGKQQAEDLENVSHAFGVAVCCVWFVV